MSELDLYAKYLDLGVKLGRSGEDLTTWVEDKVRQDVERERSDREIERERKREEMEMQRQREEMELQKRREEIALQDRREERELKRLELEAETKKLEIGSKNGADGAGPRPSYSAQRPKIPPLHDLSQVDLYLERFGCDRNGFRHKFLTVKPQETEDFGTFTNRARRYFDRWVELSGVSTLEGLSYLVCSEIALQECDEDFVAYIKDRSPSDMVALKTVASAYMDARPNKSFHRKHPVSFAAKSEPYRPIVRVTDRQDDSRHHGRGGRINIIILRRGTDRPVFKVILIWLREVLLVRPPGTEVNLMLLTRMLARVNLDLVRAVFLVMLLAFSAVARDMSAVNVRAAPGRQVLLLWCQSYLHIAVPPKWTVILGVD
ncbi:hypothetical protein PoB_003538600 [Plakobranchus ocellatus]|uniref:SCAN box domain-containing protein n=1 Tax=Plakobranchus ocellatus TaxID=259542 RepID=A0AAV4AQN4_9GAST|nr:hypothetical protein PoB_003538600 [Plakobranchus ocellatus]